MKPATVWNIGREAKALYKAEEHAVEAVHSVATQLAKFLTKEGHYEKLDSEATRYEREVPDALAAVLIHFAPSVSIPAAVGYLLAPNEHPEQEGIKQVLDAIVDFLGPERARRMLEEARGER